MEHYGAFFGVTNIAYNIKDKRVRSNTDFNHLCKEKPSEKPRVISKMEAVGFLEDGLRRDHFDLIFLKFTSMMVKCWCS